MDVLEFSGVQGGIEIPAQPDTTFKAEITALIAAKTKVVGKLDSLTFSDNIEVTSPADGVIPDGMIIACRPVQYAAGTDYELTVKLFSYLDQNSERHTPVCIVSLPYSDTVALQDSVVIDGTTYMSVKDGTTGGWGAVISKDTSAEKVEVLF